MSAYPLYMTDEQIAIAVLGEDRAHEWPAILAHLESENADRLPPISTLMGGRFWPHVVQYLDMLEKRQIANEGYAARMRDFAAKQVSAPPKPVDDILRGADAIAEFVYGDKEHRR